MQRRIRDFVWLANLVREVVLDKVEIDPDGLRLEEVLPAHPRLLVALNHGPVVGPLPALLAVIGAYAEHGGRDRVPVGVTWRDFYRVPGIRTLASLLTQIDHPAGFEECCLLLRDGPFTDMMLMPEGSNANWGDGSVVQEFRTPRFVELAARGGCPILLVAHTGTEAWARHLPHASWWDPGLGLLGEIGARIKSAGGINLSFPRGRIDTMRLSFALYSPDATRVALDGDDEALREAVRHDAAACHAILSSRVRKLRGGA